jgi:DNA modification methylase
MSAMDVYVEDVAESEKFTAYLGDSCERLKEIATDSIGLSVCSPPFASLFVYSPSLRDLGNSGSREQFIEHYKFIIREQLRVTMPGRIACIHVQQLTTTKSTHGAVGMTDFRGEVIRAFMDEGWIFHGEATVWKDPQAQSIRTKSFSLAFATKNRDSSMSRPALADYLLLFRKPGDNPEPIKNDVTNNEWIDWASPIWLDTHEGGGAHEGGDNLAPVWLGIRETRTLNTRAAKDNSDEKHIAPLQLDFIERCVRLWSNEGDLVLSPFMGIGSEGYVSLKLGRRFVGIELKPSYWAQAVKNLRIAERDQDAPSLFDDEELVSG